MPTESLPLLTPCSVLTENGDLRPAQAAARPPLDGGPVLWLMALTAGEISLIIPETGKRSLSAGEWGFLSDLGPASSVRSQSPCGFSAGLPLSAFAGNHFAGHPIPPKLNCLRCPRRDAAFFIKGSCCGRLATLARELSGVAPESLSALWMHQSHLAEFVARVLERPELHASPPCRSCCCGRDLEAIEQVAHFLQNNLADPHSIPSLARTFHLNECKLKRGFRQHFGTTIFAYLRRLRMEKAWALLHQSDATVLEVANAVGYSNPSHFARAFRDVHALNPSEVKGPKS